MHFRCFSIPSIVDQLLQSALARAVVLAKQRGESRVHAEVSILLHSSIHANNSQKCALKWENKAPLEAQRGWRRDRCLRQQLGSPCKSRRPPSTAQSFRLCDQERPGYRRAKHQPVTIRRRANCPPYRSKAIACNRTHSKPRQSEDGGYRR